jgi:hypothetical protein
MKIGLFYLFVSWTVIVILMAATDAFGGGPDNFRVAAWLVLFFIGTALTIWSLVLYPIQHKYAEHMAGIATTFIAGLFLAVYNITWEICMLIQEYNYNFFPVPLYPFPIAVNTIQWYAMIAVGFVLIGGSTYIVSKENFK